MPDGPVSSVQTEWKDRIKRRLEEALEQVFLRREVLAIGKRGRPTKRRNLLDGLHLCIISDEDIVRLASVEWIASYPRLRPYQQDRAKELTKSLDHRSIIERLDDAPEPHAVAIMRKIKERQVEYRLLELRAGHEDQWQDDIQLMQCWMRDRAEALKPDDSRRWIWDMRRARSIDEQRIRHMLVFPITDGRLSTKEGVGKAARVQKQTLCGLAYVQLRPKQWKAALRAVGKNLSALQGLKTDLMQLWPFLLCYETITTERAGATSWLCLGDVISNSLVRRLRRPIRGLKQQPDVDLQGIGKTIESALRPRHLRRRRGMPAIGDHVVGAVGKLAEHMRVPEAAEYVSRFYEHEQRLFLDPRYREHFVHQFQVYLIGANIVSEKHTGKWLGSVLSGRDQVVAKALGMKADSTPSYSIWDLHRCWFVAANMHDVAAALEGAREIPEQLAEEFLFVDEGLEGVRAANPFLGMSWRQGRGGIRKGKSNVTERRGPLWMRVAPINSLLQLVRLYHMACQLGGSLTDCSCNKHWITAKSTWDSVLLQLVEDDINHAALGAALTVQAGVRAVERANANEMAERESDLRRIYLPAAHAVLLHDKKSAEKLQEAAVPGVRRSRGFVFELYPVAGILAFADLIHNWGRPSLGGSPERLEDCRLRRLDATVEVSSAMNMTAAISYVFGSGAVHRGLDEIMKTVNSHYETYGRHWRAHGDIEIKGVGYISGKTNEQKEFGVHLRHPTGSRREVGAD